MDHRQVQSRQGVTLIGGGNPTAESLDEALKIAPHLIAADGGADLALGFGHIPATVIGDLDSVSQAARDRVGPDNIIETLDQDRTDFEKCLMRIEAPFVIGVGFLAGRVDHTLAALSALVQHDGPPTILVGDDDVVFAAPLQLSLDLKVGSRFSLFPLTELRGRSTGLEWPLDPHHFTPMGRIGTSNRVTGPVECAFSAPGMIVITPREAMARVVAALTG